MTCQKLCYYCKLPKYHETLSKRGTQEYHILTKFSLDWVKIVDFLVIRCDAKKKVSKFGWKFYLTKGSPILLKFWHFLDKVSGNNVLKF